MKPKQKKKVIDNLSYRSCTQVIFAHRLNTIHDVELILAIDQVLIA